MAEAGLLSDSRKAGEDILVGLCGLATSVVTALILWFIEAQFGFALYSWMFWFVLPVGAFLSGFAGASGYYAGSWFFGHRPTGLLRFNIVVASVATFFLIYYLSYVTMEVDGKQVSDYLPFWQYLDIAIRSTSMEFRFRGAIKVGETGELGYFGYVISVLQVIGFATGGFAVYGYLVSQPFCEKCSRYLASKGRQIRYTGDGDSLQASTAKVFDHIKNGALTSAVEEQRGFGTPHVQKDFHLRSVVAVRYCKKCSKHWVKFTVEKQSGNDWKEIPDLSVAGFTEQVVNV